jgi:cytochrome c551/c552
MEGVVMGKVGVEMPNWFDNEYQDSFKNATAEQMLAAIAKNPRVIEKVKGKLAEHDARAGFAGPSRTQVARAAIAEILQEPS